MIKKKMLALLMVIALITGLVAACAAPAPAPAPTPAPAPAPAQPAAVITWTGQGHGAAASEMYKSMERMSERATTNSGGQFVLKSNPAGAIVPAAKEFDGVNGGSLDYAMTAYTYWKDKFPAAGLFTFTVAGLSPVEQMLWHLQGDGNALSNEMIKGYNVYLIPGFIGSAEIFLSTSKPIKSLADIKGLKIRTAGDDGVLFARMGAAVVSLPSGEIYESMQRGVIDSFQCSSPAVDYSMSLQEVAKYIYLSGTRQPSEFHSYLINTDSWAKLPDDLKGFLQDTILAEAWRYYALITKMDSEAVQSYKDYGCNVAPIPKDVEDEIVRQAEIYYNEEAAKDAFFAKVLKSQRDFQKAIREAFPRL